MKYLYTLNIICLSTLFFIVTPLQAQTTDPADGSLFSVEAKVEFIKMPRAMAQKYATLFTEGKQSASESQVTSNQINEAIDKKQAELIGTAQVSTKSRMEARGQSSHEYIYITGYNDKGIPEFATRGLGTILAVNPVVSQNKSSIDITLVAEYTMLAGTRPTTISLPNKSNPVTVNIPEIVVRKTETNIYIKDGQTVLLGIYDGVNKDGTKDENSLIISLLKVQINQL